MDFEMHLKILRFCKTRNITTGTLIRHIYELIKDHEGKDFKDLDDFFTKLYPKRPNHSRSKPRRESPFYNTPVQDLEEEANE